MTTQQEIDQIKRELEEISPWPWQWEEPWFEGSQPDAMVSSYIRKDKEDYTDNRIIITDNGYYPPFGADKEFIAKSPERISALIKDREVLLQRIEKLEKVLLDKITEFGEVQGYDKKNNL